MARTNLKYWSALLILVPLVAGCAPSSRDPVVAEPGTYDDLVALFHEFREFQRPLEVEGVPDYTPAAMGERYGRLREYQQRLAGIEASSWPVAQQVDYHVVRAEMNGVEFEHAVTRPWARDPVFYLYSMGGAGPTAAGRPRVSELPMTSDQAASFRSQLQATPGLLMQARSNLTEGSADLARFALHFLDSEIALYEGLRERLRKHHPDMNADLDRVVVAVEEYGAWIEASIDTMTAPAGIGKENYNWLLKNVHLVPYTWDDLYVSLTREYEHSVGALKIVEHRNRALPPLPLVSSDEEYLQRWLDDEAYLGDFIRDQELFTVPDYLTSFHPGTWWNAPGSEASQDFFEQCRDRDMLAEVAHNTFGHHLDEMIQERDERPIRGWRRLFDIDMIRNEGMAYGLEEIIHHAGIYEERPRAEEVNLIAKAFRATRGLADLSIHSQEFTLSDALSYCYEMTPYNWMLEGGHEVWFEMNTTTRAPGWHMGMVLGKIQMLGLIEDVAHLRGDDFDLGAFIDEFRAAGMIPMSLVRWEMTGLTDEMDMLR